MIKTLKNSDLVVGQWARSRGCPVWMCFSFKGGVKDSQMPDQLEARQCSLVKEGMSRSGLCISSGKSELSPTGRWPQVGPEDVGRITYPIWLGNVLGSPKRSWGACWGEGPPCYFAWPTAAPHKPRYAVENKWTDGLSPYFPFPSFWNIHF